MRDLLFAAGNEEQPRQHHRGFVGIVPAVAAAESRPEEQRVGVVLDRDAGMNAGAVARSAIVIVDFAGFDAGAESDAPGFVQRELRARRDAPRGLVEAGAAIHIEVAALRYAPGALPLLDDGVGSGMNTAAHQVVGEFLRREAWRSASSAAPAAPGLSRRR